MLPSPTEIGVIVLLSSRGCPSGQALLVQLFLGLGASGSTFYDDAVTEFFSPHGEHANPMIAVGVGVPGYKARPGRILPQFIKG